MIKHIWSILAQKSIIEAETNSISIIDAMEQLTVGAAQINTDKPATNTNISVPIAYEIISFLTKDNKDKEVNPMIMIQLINPKDKILKTFERQIKWEAGKDRMRARARIMGLPIDISGIYFFKVGIKEEGEKEYKTVANLPLDINIVGELPISKK